MNSIESNITECLNNRKNLAIKNIMIALENSSINSEELKNVRKIVLDEINDLNFLAFRALTYIEEQNGSKDF